MTNKELTSKDDLTALIKSKGIQTWDELVAVVQGLSYGRNSNRTDFELVMIEQKGTCSSKHSFLKKVADLNGIPNIKLILGMYKMNENNTPNIETILLKNNMEYIPEAHCYLKVNDERKDLTTQQSNFKKIESELIEELEIQPEQVSVFKVMYHQEFIKKWILEHAINLDFTEVWSIREECISNLTQNSSK